MTPQQKLARDMTHLLANQGQLIEGGFAAFLITEHPEASPEKIAELRYAYMGGAEHLFSSIMGILDPGDAEPTDADMRRMDLIHQELMAWRQEAGLKYARPEGSS